MRSCCLTIAGSDSGGNAGVQADLRTFHAYSLHGCTVFTALTAQNPNGVYAIEQIPADFVAAQLDAVLGTYKIAALKTGMLGSADVVYAVAEKIKMFVEARDWDKVSMVSDVKHKIEGTDFKVINNHNNIYGSNVFSGVLNNPQFPSTPNNNSGNEQ